MPIIQQAAIDYVNDPARTNTLILELVEAYDTDWVYYEGVAAFSVEVQAELGLVGNGPDDTLGQHGRGPGPEIIDQLAPIYAAGGKPIKEGLTADDIVTNEYIDEGIGL